MRLLTLVALAMAATALHAATTDVDAGATVTVTVTERGFEPARIEVPADRTVAIVFHRAVAATCATAVVWPKTGIRQELPVGRDVRISLRATPGTPIAFACPTSMYAGEIIAKPALPVPDLARDSGIAITVDGTGFHPNRIMAVVGERIHLRFSRTSDRTCATAVSIPALGITDTDLPLGKTIDIAVTPTQIGDIRFACAMGMVTGTLVVSAAGGSPHAP